MRWFWGAVVILLLHVVPVAGLAMQPILAKPSLAGARPTTQPTPPPVTPMRVVLVRSAEPDCEPHCAQWLSAEGDIFPGAAAEFSRALRALGNRKVPILINSRGGSVSDALAVGRMIRVLKLDIAVAKTRFASCQPADAACQKTSGFDGFRGAPDARLAICASACAYLFAGGVNRYVGFGAFIGLHQSTTKRAQVLTRYWVTTRRFADGSTQTTKKIVDQRRIDLGAAAQTSTQEYGNVAGYLQEMGVSSKEFLAIVVATPASTIHWMTPAELQTTNLSTDRRNGEYLIANIDQEARRAYLASPEYRTLAYAYALLPMGMFDERQTMLALNFSHRKNAPKVDLTAVPTSDGALLPTPPLEVDLHLTGDKSFAALNAQPRDPPAPMQAAIPVYAFCGLKKDSMIKVSLGAASNQWVADAALYTDARRFAGIDLLLAEACGK
jgi:hypothetical protein